MLVRRQSSLVFDSQASSATGISAPAITDTNPVPSAPIAASTVTVSSPTDTADPSPTVSSSPSAQQPGAAASSHPQSTINLGTVVGACIGSFAVLIMIITLVVWHSRRTRKANSSRTKRDNWNKLPDNTRDSRRSSFESKPSLPPLNLEYSTEYPPAHSDLRSRDLQLDTPRFILPTHPYSSKQVARAAEEIDETLTSDPFLDPKIRNKDLEADVASIYSAASNPFESVYTPPSIPESRRDAPDGYPRSPFFTPHPDSSVQVEKWGTVGKERNVQESFASNDTDKLGSLIAALDLESANNVDEEKADRSMHGHLGRFEH